MIILSCGLSADKSFLSGHQSSFVSCCADSSSSISVGVGQTVTDKILQETNTADVAASLDALIGGR